MNVGQLIAERDQLKREIEDAPKKRAQIRLLNQLIALADPLRSDAPNGNGDGSHDGLYGCPHCPKALATPGGLGTHLRSVHGISGGISGKPRPTKKRGRK